MWERGTFVTGNLDVNDSDGCFRAEPQNKLVGFGFDDLFGDVVMGQVGDAAEQRDVSLPQLEDGAVLDAPRQENVTDERPRLNGALFLVVLSIYKKKW